MSSAELKRKKLDLIAWIKMLSDEHLIEFLDRIKSSGSKDDWWANLSENQQSVINIGIKDIDEGRVMTSDQFWKNLKSE
jgi:hypothetical protein